ncbi:MAG: MBL fold metallo-hydrolase [Steroidobacteraceae bacterium]
MTISQLPRVRIPVALTALLLPLAAVLAAAPPAGPAPTELPKLIKIRDDVYTIENVNANLAELGAFGGNVTVYLTDEGVILVDSKNDKVHDDIVAKVKTLTDKPIKYVILTHNHGDHASGAPAMAAMGATVIISKADRDNMVRTKQPWLPQVTYTGRADLFVGGKEIELREIKGHTRGDTVVYLPAARVVAVGDLSHNPPGIPLQVNYPDGGSWTDWVNALDTIATLDFDFVVQGHGPVLTKAEFAAFRERVFTIRERVRALNKQGKTAEEIAATLRPEFNWPAEGRTGNVPDMMKELQ